MPIPTPEAQGAAFAAAVARSGIQSDFGGMSEDAQKNYWISQAQTIMGPQWDCRSADVAAFAESIGLTPGQTVERKMSTQDDVVLYTGGWYGNAYECEPAEPCVYYRADIGAITLGALHVSPTGVFHVNDHRIAIHIEASGSAYSWGSTQMLGKLTTWLYVNITDPNGVETHLSYDFTPTDVRERDIRTDRAITVQFSYFFMPFWNSGKSCWNIRLYARAVFSWTRQIADIEYPEELYIHSTYYAPCALVDTIIGKWARQIVTFTMPAGGLGSWEEEAEPVTTLRFTARAGTAGTHGDPYTGVFAVPAPRTEVPSCGCGGYGGHGGGGGAGGATTIIHSLATDRADAVEQFALTRPHGYGSPGGAGGPGGDGCILIFW